MLSFALLVGPCRSCRNPSRFRHWWPAVYTPRSYRIYRAHCGGVPYSVYCV